MLTLYITNLTWSLFATGLIHRVQHLPYVTTCYSNSTYDTYHMSLHATLIRHTTLTICHYMLF